MLRPAHLLPIWPHPKQEGLIQFLLLIFHFLMIWSTAIIVISFQEVGWFKRNLTQKLHPKKKNGQLFFHAFGSWIGGVCDPSFQNICWPNVINFKTYKSRWINGCTQNVQKQDDGMRSSKTVPHISAELYHTTDTLDPPKIPIIFVSQGLDFSTSPQFNEFWEPYGPKLLIATVKLATTRMSLQYKGDTYFHTCACTYLSQS